MGCTQIYDTDDFEFAPPADSSDSSSHTAVDSDTDTSTDTSQGEVQGQDTSVASVTCGEYCSDIGSLCVDGSAQYATATQCEEICRHMSQGNVSDTTGNTLECRFHHTQEAHEDQSFCAFAGPGGSGVCGSNCESFCQLQSEICVGSNQQYDSVEACMAICAAFNDDVVYNSTILGGDSLACRISHLALATGSPAIHCSHVAPVSPVCN